MLDCMMVENGKPLRYSCLENSMNSMKRHKDRTLKDASLGATGPQPLSLHFTARAPQQKKPPQRETYISQLESSLSSPQLEKPCMPQQRLHTAKNK